MCVKVYGRELNASAVRTLGCYFVKCGLTDGDGLKVGSTVEVDGTLCSVRYLIAGSCGEPEVWMILAPGVQHHRARTPR